MVILKVLTQENVAETSNVPLQSTVVELKSLAASKSGEKSENYGPPSNDELESLLVRLQATLVDPHHRALLSRIAMNPETLKNLIDCVPGLRQDTIAQAVLKDPYLLLHWVDDENAAQNFIKHPCLFAACQHVVEHLHAEVLRHSGLATDNVMFPPPPPDVAVGDPFLSDDEDEDGDMGQQAPSAAARQQITAHHLATALAAAAGMAAPGNPNRPTTSAPTSSNTGATGSRHTPSQQASSAPTSYQQPAQFITPDMFRQAVQQALQQQQQQPNYETQLIDLRNMGFTNDEENLRALRISDGNVQAALEFIINERERQEQGFGLD